MNDQRGCPFCQRKIVEVDYKDVALIKRLRVLRPDGQIKPRQGKRLRPGKRAPGGSGVCRRHQASLATAVKRARFMALLPNPGQPKSVEWRGR